MRNLLFKKDKYSSCRVSWKETSKKKKDWAQKEILSKFKAEIKVFRLFERNIKLINSKIFLIIDYKNRKIILSEKKNSIIHSPLTIEEKLYKSRYFALMNYVEGDHFNGSLAHFNIMVKKLPKKIFYNAHKSNISNAKVINYEEVVYKTNNFLSLYGSKYASISELHASKNRVSNYFLKEFKNIVPPFKLEKNSTKLYLNIDLHPHNIIINEDSSTVTIIDEDARYRVNAEIAIGFHIFKTVRQIFAKNKNVDINLLNNYLNIYINNLSKFSLMSRKLFNLETLLDNARIEILRRIILILDEYFLKKKIDWLPDLTMHSSACFEISFLKKKLLKIS